MDFKGEARPLSDGDVVTIAGYLGCHVAAVRAVLAVESAGHGFASDGRPIILNEPHVFYRELSGGQRTQAVNAGLAYSRWGSKPYPKTQAARYAWLDKAMSINQTAALKSCSWGLGQVMGFNHAICGFPTVQEFVEAMKVSEGAQLYAVARFCVSKGLQKRLRSLDWTWFAYGYNGEGYAKHGYHTKLANAYARRPAGEKFTPSPATEAQLRDLIEGSIVVSPPAVDPPAPAETWSPNRGVYLKKGDRGPRVAELIQDLHTLGHYRGTLDDWFWTGTENAVLAFQRAHGLDVDGVAGPITLDAIDEALVAGGHRKAATKVAVTASAAAVTMTGTVAAGFDPWLAALVGVAVAVSSLVVFNALKG